MMANEKRLIDANALESEIRKMFVQYGDGTYPNDREAMIYDEALVEVLEALDTAPAVDAVPVDKMREFAEDVVYQFGYYGQYNGQLHIGHGGLSTLEEAFDILGWDNPHPAPEFECEIDGCHEHATCGAPTSDGYKRMCGKHFGERRTDNG